MFSWNVVADVKDRPFLYKESLVGCRARPLSTPCPPACNHDRRHADGREALVELVGFWTPEYLEAKARKIAAAGLDHLVLVAYRGLAVGSAREWLDAEAGEGRLVWFTERPRAAEVMRAVERWARRVGT